MENYINYGVIEKISKCQNYDAIENESGKRLLETPDEFPAFMKQLYMDIASYEQAVAEDLFTTINDPDLKAEVGKNRTTKHNNIIIKINMLNRIALWITGERVYTGPETDGSDRSARHFYAQAAFEMLYIFLNS